MAYASDDLKKWAYELKYSDKMHLKLPMAKIKRDIGNWENNLENPILKIELIESIKKDKWKYNFTSTAPSKTK